MKRKNIENQRKNVYELSLSLFMSTHKLNTNELVLAGVTINWKYFKILHRIVNQYVFLVSFFLVNSSQHTEHIKNICFNLH